MTLLSYADLKKRGVPYTETHLHRLMKAGTFPEPVKLGQARNSRKAWLEQEIDDWMAARIAKRDGAAQ